MQFANAAHGTPAKMNPNIPGAIRKAVEEGEVDAVRAALVEKATAITTAEAKQLELHANVQALWDELQYMEGGAPADGEQ